MFESVRMENFRGLESLEVPLSPLTVLVGPSGVGKSSVLDALLLADSSLAQSVIHVVHRRQGLSDAANWVVRYGATRSRVVLTSDGRSVVTEVEQRLRTQPVLHARRGGADDWSEACGVEFFPPAPRVTSTSGVSVGSPVVLVDSTAPFDPMEAARRLTELRQAGSKRAVDAALKAADPRLVALEMGAAADGSAVPYVDFETGAVPLALAGDGVRFLAQLTTALVLARGGTALLEEPETHLHPRALGALTDVIAARIAESQQVVLTTHSAELVDQLFDAVAASGTPTKVMRVVRLSRSARELTLQSFRGDEISFRRSDMGEDLR